MYFKIDSLKNNSLITKIILITLMVLLTAIVIPLGIIISLVVLIIFRKKIKQSFKFNINGMDFSKPNNFKTKEKQEDYIDIDFKNEDNYTHNQLVSEKLR